MEGNGKKKADWVDCVFRGNQENQDVVEEVKAKEVKEKKGEKGKNKVEREVIPGGRRSSRRAAAATLEAEREAEEEKVQEAPVLEKMEPTLEQASYALSLIAPTFATHLARELEHETRNLSIAEDARPLIRIKDTPLTRSLCDFCSTSIFMGSYMCGSCGREFCLGCWETWTPSDNVHNNALLKRNQCSKKRRHIKENCLFVTRARPSQLAELLEDINARAALSVPIDTAADGAAIATIPTETAPPIPNTSTTYLSVPKIPIDDLKPSTFSALWRRGGTPLILTNCLPRFSLPWSPSYFTTHFSTTPCTIHDTRTSLASPATVGGFFSTFTSPIGESYKLKDWPPTASFSTTFPTLFADWEHAVPFPSYARRDGPLNLASYFPPDWNQPDLGPKMYNAYPAADFLPDHDPNDGVTGTTNLHLDLTDAVNILLYASPEDYCPPDHQAKSGIPACGAVWDIFPPSTSASIRSYLHHLHPDSGIDDPIHRQLYYLSEHDLTVLSMEPWNVKSFRIYQNPGDAVWIPAGCPHQVRNRKSCVKVAVDFLSPENVKVAKGLGEEGRNMMQEVVRSGWSGKEDVLQLWGALGFAWRALREVEQKAGVKQVEKVEMQVGE